MKLADELLETAKFPHDQIQLKLCRIVSQVAMRMYKTAMEEIEQIGSFEDKQNCYENYQQFYPNKKGKIDAEKFFFSFLKSNYCFFFGRINDSFCSLYD